MTTRDVCDVLTEDHRRIEELLSELRAGAVTGEAARDTADLLISALVRHSVAEEMYVYPVIREYLPGGEESVQHDVDEHQELEELLVRLERAQPQDAEFLHAVTSIQTTLADHVNDEESEQFPLLRQHVPTEKLVQLVDKVEMAERIAPTRPHPAAPHSELFHKTVGAGVGMVDRLRDALSGRLTS
jgi:hemerythrin superfamily protein